MKDKKLVAFNMYETWVDSGPMISPYKTLFSRLCLSETVSRNLAKTLMTTTQNVEDVLPKLLLPPEEIDEHIEQFYKDMEIHLASLSLFPEFQTVIEQLKSSGYATAVVSNLSKFYAYPFEQLIDPKLFDYKVLSFETGLLKPNREIFDYLLSTAHILPQDAIMVGDSLHSDVQGAFSAGIQPVHIDRSSQGIHYHERYTQISTLTDLFSLLDN